MKNNAVKYLFFLVLVLPLLNLPPWFSPPDWGKTIVFRIIVSAILFFFVWNIKSISFPSLKKKESLALVLLLLLVGIFFLATLFSFDRSFSFWGTPSRAGGFLNFALIIFFAIAAFLTFKPKDWQKAWDIAILICGVLVAVLAVFQWRGWLSNVLAARATRPASTLGNDIQLGMYLILLSFPALAFLLKEKENRRKIFYAIALLLFLFVIVLTGSRGAYLGLFAGFSYFILFFPFKKLSHSLISKLAFFLIILVPFLLVYYVNTHSLPQFIQKSVTLNSIAGRLQLEQFIRQEPRFSTWKVGWNAIWARPLLGYGPENFEVAFDKYYNPTYPNIEYRPQSSNTWWDRAHNFIVDNAAQAGIFALALYLGVFSVLIFQLQKLKKEGTDSGLLAHGLQATFIAYLASVFFGFDTFSTYLISFFAAAYALFLLRREQPIQPQTASNFTGKYVVAGILAVALLWFNWQFNLRPLGVNANIVLGVNAMEQKKCGPAVSLMEGALKKGSTFLDAYLNARYFDVLRNCQVQATEKDQLSILAKDYSLMKTAATLWPYHTRNWIFLGQLAALLAQQEISSNQISREQATQLIQEGNAYFEKAQQLSPKHQEIYIEWTRTYLALQNYEGALQKAQECIAVDSRTNDCWWLKGLARVYLGQLKQSHEDLNSAYQHGLRVDDTDVILKFASAYATTKNYPELIKTYQKLIQIDPKGTQYHASLAAAYKETGQIQRARAEALKVLELNPQEKDEVEKFLQSL